MVEVPALDGFGFASLALALAGAALVALRRRPSGERVARSADPHTQGRR